MIIVNIHEAKSQLSKLIRRVLQGEEVVIAKHNIPVARLEAYQQPKGKRGGYGLLKGQIELVEGWDSADNEIEELVLGSHIEPYEGTSD